MDIKDTSVLVLDNGFFVSFAQELTKYFKTVYYSTEPSAEYPTQKDLLTGYGLPGVERITDLWEVIDDVDTIAIPDIFYGDMTDYLRSKKYPVWGGGRLEQLESNRLFLKETLKELKLPVNDYKLIIGIDKLRTYLKANDDKYIKCDQRGDFESWHHSTYELSEPFLNEMEHFLGAGSKIYPFMVEAPIEAVEEVGIDTFIINGEHPNVCQLGVEIKDQSYACYTKAYKDIPKTVTECVDALAELMKEAQYAQFFSSECRVEKSKKSFLIDATCRLGSPSGGSQLSMYSNLGDIIYYGARGIMTEPKYKYKYCVEIFLRSAFATKNWLPLYLSDKDMEFYSFRNLCKIEDIYYIIPHQTGMAEIGTIRIGADTLDEAMKIMAEKLEALKGFDVDYDLDAGKKAVAALEEAIDKKII